MASNQTSTWSDGQRYLDLPRPGFNARLTHPAGYGKMETNGSQSRQIWKSIKANRKEGSVTLIKAISRIFIIMEKPMPSLAPSDAPLPKLPVPFWYCVNKEWRQTFQHTHSHVSIKNTWSVCSVAKPGKVYPFLLIKYQRRHPGQGSKTGHLQSGPTERRSMKRFSTFGIKERS